MTELFLYSAADWLLTYAAHSTLLLGGVWLVQRIGVLRTDAHRELAWKLALPGAVLSATLQLTLVANPLGGTLAVVTKEPVVSEAAAQTRARQETGAPVPVAEKLETKNPVSPAAAQRAARHTGPVYLPARWVPGLRALDWPLLIVSLWLSGVLLLGSRQVYIRLLLERELRSRRPIIGGRVHRVLIKLHADSGRPPPRISVAPGLPTPIALARGEICLPLRACTDLHGPQLEAMLAHELAHLERRDPWWLWLCAFVEVLFYFQPLNRLARREIIDVAEFLTDRRAVGMTADSRALAECLAQVAEWLHQQRAPVAVGQVSGMAVSVLPERVRRLAANKLQGEGIMTRKLLIPLVAVVAFAGAGMLPGVDLFANDAQAASTSRHVTVEDEGGRVRMDVSTSDEHMRMELKARGHIQFAADDSDITGMADGDYFDLTVSRDGDKHRVRVEGDRGRLARSWWINGDEQPWNAQAAAWFADTLPEVFRRTGINAEQRVAYRLSNGGVDAVLEEIELIHGDHAQRIYLTTLVELSDPSAKEMSRAIRLAGEQIGSDFELRTVLVAMLEEPGLDDSAWSDFFAAARTIGSDFEQRQVLTELARRVPFDGNRALLREYLETSTGIGSDFEMRQALTALLDHARLDEESLSLLLLTTRKIGSDFEQASTLIQAVPQVTGKAVDAYLDASGEIGSDFEQRRALDALVQNTQLSSEEAIRFLDASTQISSDFELASLMIDALPVLPADARVRDYYRDIAKRKLGSDYERNRVLAALADY